MLALSFVRQRTANFSRLFYETFCRIVPPFRKFYHELAWVREAYRVETAARERLEEALGVLQTALTLETPGISRIDANGCYQEINDCYARLVGYTPEELVGKHWSTVFVSPDLNEAALAYEYLATNGKAEFEARAVRKDGSVVHLHVVNLNLTGPAGQPLGHRCLIRDLSDRKKTEAALHTAERRKAQRDAVVREVHHRFKNHLQAALGLLGSHLSKSSEANAVIQAATAQLLTLAAIHGLQATGDEEVTLEAAVPAIIRSLEPSTEGIAVEFSSELEQDRHILIAEDERAPLALIIGELIFNAGKHGAGRPIRVTMTREGEGLGLSIVNPGRLPAGFEWAGLKGLGTGLSLVASLLPAQGISLSIFQEEDRVIARLLIGKPVIRES